MPCQTPFRDDTQQMLLFKIASCLSDGDFIAGVASFNGRTGNVTLEAGDITAALGCTPLCESDGDARYVLKSGDSMTGALSIDNGVLVANEPALELSQTWNNAAVTFTGLYENITLTAASANSNLFNFQVNGSDRFNFTSGGTLRAIRQDASDAGVNFFLRKRGNAGDANGAVAADSTIGAISYSGWDGTAFATGSHIDGLAAEAWTNLAHGSRINFYTTPVGSTTEQLSLQLNANGQARFLDGTAALPALTFQSDPDTGIYRIGANSVGHSANGVLTIAVNTTGVDMTSGLSYKYNGANVLNGITAQFSYFVAGAGNLTGSGVNNMGVGPGALAAVTTGAGNSAFGRSSLLSNTTGSDNVGVGRNSLQSNMTGTGNVSIGVNSSVGLTTGSENTVIGRLSAGGLDTGSQNTIIGANVSGLAAALSNNIILADGAGVIRLQINSSGNTTLAGTVQTAAGTAALPAFSFTGDPNTGLYNIGADSLGLSTGGTLRVTTNTTDLILATAFRLAMASGANTRAGNATLVAGTVTVANTSVTANTIVMLTRKTSGGTLGTAITYTVIAATSFTINSDSALDTSTFSYLLIENP